MKKILTFIPLGVGISSAIIYLFNIIQFRVINSSVTLLQILSNLKVYIYISIISFILYFIIKVIILMSEKNNFNKIEDNSDCYEPFENNDNNESVDFVNTNIKNETNDTNNYVPNYDYVPIYNDKEKNNDITNDYIEEPKSEKIIIDGNKYCSNCGEKIFDTDNYCKKCGSYQMDKKSGMSPFMRNLINVLEIVILILVVYFSLNMLFEYKHYKDPNFESPFKISMTK